MKTTQIKAGLVALFSLTLVAGAVFIAPQAHAAVYADIQANGQDGPITIASGASVPLIWTSQGATACDVQPINYHGTSGGGMTGPLTSSQTYYLTCTGQNGEVGSDIVIVNVGGGNGGSPITVTIDANPATIYRGDTSTLTWSSTNATDCYASIGWSGGKPVNGSTPVNPQQTTTYRINCSNSSPASAHAETTVTVLDPVNPPSNPGAIRGYKVNRVAGNDLRPFSSGTGTVTVNGIGSKNENPYSFSVDSGTYTVSASSISGYTLIGYTLCQGGGCHSGTPTPGNSVTVNVSAGQAYDLWWQYSADTVTPPAGNGTIQGYKVHGASLTPIGQGTAIRVNGGSIGVDTNNPYGFTLAPGTYTVSADALSGFTLVGYTLCVNSTNCHNNTPTPGSATITVVSGNSYDLWWHYSENAVTPPANNYPIGYFDSATCEAISGWARDIDSDPTPATSNAAVTIQIFNGPAQNGQLLGQLSANGAREATVGNHGFSWTVPSSLKDGQTRQIYVYALDVQDNSKSSLLNGSPKSLTCGGPITPVPPTVTINANPQTINQGQQSTLTWSSQNATTCSASTGWGGTKALSGSEVVTPQVTTLYGITCFNNSGQSAYAQTTVTVTPVNNVPTVTLNANPRNISRGQSSVLTWTSQNATTCIASAGWFGTKTLTGSEIVNPAITTTYFITCFNAIGTQATAQDTVTVQGDPNNAPTVTLIANPPSIAQGQSSVLTWTSQNATSCSASNGWAGGKSINGSEVTYPSVTTTYTITCYNIAGQSAYSTAVVSVNPINNIPTVSINANPQTINQGQNSVLTWTSQNATTCSASSGWSGSKSINGSESVQPGGTTTYTITCYNASGQSAYAQTVVIVNQTGGGNYPSVNLTANPSSINQGQNSTLYWSSQNANTCYASGGNWNGSKNLSGSEVVSPFQTTSYTITCIGTNGQQVQSTATVFVNNFQNQQLPTVTLTANPTSVNPGQQSMLTWTSYNANTCYASGGNWSGQKGTSGNESVYPQITTTYTITCSNNYGSANDTEVVYTTGGPNYGGTTAQVTKNVLNRTLNQTTFVNSVEGQGLDVLEFEIRVRNNDSQMRNVVVQDPLPQELFYVAGSTSVNGINTIDGIANSNGLVLNNMNPNEERTIRFRAVIFAGTTPRTITNQANASGFGSGTTYGSATIVVRNRGVVLGISDISTGAGGSLIWSIFLGFFAALLFHAGADKAGWYDVVFSKTARTTVASTNVPVSDRPRRIEELLHAVRKRNGISEPAKTKPSK